MTNPEKNAATISIVPCGMQAIRSEHAPSRWLSSAGAFGFDVRYVDSLRAKKTPNAAGGRLQDRVEGRPN